MDIRDGTREDAGSIERISRASFDRVYAFFAIRGRRRAWPLLIAEEDGVVLGFLEGRLFDGEPPIGYVYFVAVDPAHRRRNLGRTLVEESLRRFRERGATRVFAAVPSDNDASKGLFATLGFSAVPGGALRRWYGPRGLVIPMRMMIAPHEVLLVRTFADPSPASPDAVPRP